MRGENSPLVNVSSHSPVAFLRDARKSALLRTRLTNDVDMTRTSETPR
jgi:hypothetical protein